MILGWMQTHLFLNLEILLRNGSKILNVAQQGGSKDGVRLTEIKIVLLVNDILSPAFKQIRQTMLTIILV
jgi:hypothetical protein